MHRLSSGLDSRAAAIAFGDGCVAQLVEQLTLNQRVQGSNPCTPTNDFSHLAETISCTIKL